MCGIAGYKTERPIEGQVIEKMTNALTHRGPDAVGAYRTAAYHGAMRRLSINDIAHGDQPLFNGARSVVLFYNGEIYNSPELRVQLEQKGYRFRTHSDGEVICHLYDEYGEELFGRLDGMFAVALWDEAKQRLILARDLAGEKPLYYAKLSMTEVAYASELKSLKHFPGLDLSLNKQALWDFPTFLWIPEPSTVYNGIFALPRGHVLTADGAGICVRAYSSTFTSSLSAAASDQDVVAETRRVVTEAVRSRLLSDVPVGSFLSGGLDSSIIATIASYELSDLTTFCVGFEDVSDPYHGRSDESVAAAEYAKVIGSKHHTIRVTADTFRDDLNMFCRYGDQPFAVSSGLGILSVSRRAHEEGIKVLLSGDGADECFGGYSWYKYLEAQPTATKSHVGAPISFQNVGLDMQGRLSALAGYSPQERAWAWHYYAAESEKASLFNTEAFTNCDTSLRHFQVFKGGDSWQGIDYIRQDREFYLPFEMLRKVDRMTMAFSVEGRVPFVAPSVFKHVEQLGINHMVRDDTLKWALREAFSDILPQEVTRRPKHGFNVPIDHWLKGEWADLVERTFEAGSAMAKLGLLAPDALAKARAMLHDTQRLNGHTIFCYVMLNMWLEKEEYGNHS